MSNTRKMSLRERLHNFHPDVKVIHSQKAKRLALRLDIKERNIRYVIPHRITLKKAMQFLETHREWVNEKINTLPEAVLFQDGAELPLFGETFILQIDYQEDIKRTSFHMNDGVLKVITNKQDPSARVERHLRELARKYLTELAHEKAGIINKKITGIRISDTKSRWGSCGSDGKISFSWRLIFAPLETI